MIFNCRSTVICLFVFLIRQLKKNKGGFFFVKLIWKTRRTFSVQCIILNLFGKTCCTKQIWVWGSMQGKCAVHSPHEKKRCRWPCWQQCENYLWRRCTEQGSDTSLEQNEKKIRSKESSRVTLSLCHRPKTHLLQKSKSCSCNVLRAELYHLSHIFSSTCFHLLLSLFQSDLYIPNYWMILKIKLLSALMTTYYIRSFSVKSFKVKVHWMNICIFTIVVLGKVKFDEGLCFQFLW